MHFLRVLNHIETYLLRARGAHIETCNSPPAGIIASRFTLANAASVNARRRYQTHGLLPLVHSAINLALPTGPFDDSAVGHRASCNAGAVTPEKEKHLLPMFLHSASTSPIGFLRPSVVDEILKDHDESGNASIWNVRCRPDRPSSPWAICFADSVVDEEARTNAIRALLEKWRTRGAFSDMLKGWSDETYPVYTPPRERRPRSGSRLAFGIERAALPLFGFTNFGCLLTAFYDCPVTRNTRVWIARRSLTKRTWPGAYDCTVGGGIGLGETPNETIIRECMEEAGFAPDFVRQRVCSTGMLNYANRSPSGWLLPGIYYLYELRLPDDGSVVPRTRPEGKGGDEVDTFEAMVVADMLPRLREGRFKPSSAMSLVDFCVRRGIVTPESDPAYLDICIAMRRPVVLPLP